MNPLPAASALEQYFLEARCRLLDIAAILDRVGRGELPPETLTDTRLSKIARAIEVLASPDSNKAERIQQIFSLEYDPAWQRPKPRF